MIGSETGPHASIHDLAGDIAGCNLCPRLVRFRETVPDRAAFRGQAYWRKPVPGFGDPEAWLLLLGLAPAAHGGNRTGRVFTGDESARFLMQVLYKTGFANQPFSTSREDGLVIKGCYITASVKCVPPDNKPTPHEFAVCSRYLEEEVRLLRNLTSVIVLGQLAFKTFIEYAKKRGADTRGAGFAHGASFSFGGLPRLYVAYHPSPRNTYTGKLTEPMLAQVFERAKRERRALRHPPPVRHSGGDDR